MLRRKQKCYFAYGGFHWLLPARWLEGQLRFPNCRSYFSPADKERKQLQNSYNIISQIYDDDDKEKNLFHLVLKMIIKEKSNPSFVKNSMRVTCGYPTNSPTGNQPSF